MKSARLLMVFSFGLFCALSVSSHSGVEDIDKRNKICIREFKEVLKKPAHAAFALSPVFENGQSCAKASNKKSRAEAVRLVLASCKARMKKNRSGFKGKCRIIYSQ